METKTKIISAASLILVITFSAFGIYFFKKSNNQIKKEDPFIQEKPVVVNEESPSDTNITKKQTTVANGKISSIDRSSINISLDEEEKKLILSDKISIYSITDGKVFAKSISDLKNGMEVSVEYSTNDHIVEAISIKE